MASTATAAVASSFSTSTQLFIRTRLKNWPSDPLFKLATTPPMLQVASLSHSLGFEQISIGAVSQKWRLPRISAAVAQEEAAVTAPVEEEPVEAEKKQEEGEVVVSTGGEATEDATVNTKLYFGNLPYLCDSAQLAGIIQDYASPELVENNVETISKVTEQ
ncbi:unnamed protein product [Ilex paraguariensis]|uniref:RNA-binding protein n=1 Tax=Ilex paraguariensis TaxID=185542 RepID=A0ABC8TH09_9AQUA